MPYSDDEAREQPTRDDEAEEQPTRGDEAEEQPTRDDVYNFLVAQRGTTTPWFTSDEVVEHFESLRAAVGAAFIPGIVGKILGGMTEDRAARVRRHLDALVQSEDVEKLENKKDGLTLFQAH